MLCKNNYPQEYIDRCKSRTQEQIAAYKSLTTAANGQDKAANKMNAALGALGPTFFNNMVVVLDTYFCHRSRTMEGKDGNAANEVRMLCASILENKSILLTDKSIRFRPEASVLKLKPGDAITLSEENFSRLSKAYFEEIESRFAE